MLRRQVTIAKETEEEAATRRNRARLYQENALRQETEEDKQKRLSDRRQRRQIQIAEETEEENAIRRQRAAEHMAEWRTVDNLEETVERNREDRERHARRTERLRLQQEETDKLQRAFDAVDHAKIVADVPLEEMEILIERRSLRRTHLIARSARIDETKVKLHNCGAMDSICEECGTKHFKKERPSDKRFTDLQIATTKEKLFCHHRSKFSSFFCIC